MIPGKQEHPRGVISYNLTQRLLRSRLVIVIESEPRLPGHKSSPVMAFFSLCKKWKGGSSRWLHAIADSAFAASKSMSELSQVYNIYVTISINNSTTSGFSNIFQFIGQNLQIGQARLYQSKLGLIETVQRQSHVDAIATNAFKLKANTSVSCSVEPSDAAGPSTSPASGGFVSTEYKLTYASAVALWENEKPVTLRKLFHLSPTFSSHDIIDIILAGTGIIFFIFFLLIFLYFCFFKISIFFSYLFFYKISV